jgi:hypothetical protein
MKYFIFLLLANICIVANAQTKSEKKPYLTKSFLKLSAMKISTGTLENFKGTNSKEEINGRLAGGGVPVTVDANGGNINLEFN